MQLMKPQVINQVINAGENIWVVLCRQIHHSSITCIYHITCVFTTCIYLLVNQICFVPFWIYHLRCYAPWSTHVEVAWPGLAGLADVAAAWLLWLFVLNVDEPEGGRSKTLYGLLACLSRVQTICFYEHPRTAANSHEQSHIATDKHKKSQAAREVRGLIGK